MSEIGERVKKIVVVKLPSLSRIVLIRPGGSRQSPGERQASPRQYTGFQIPAMAFFAHPLFVRLSHIESLDHKPRRPGQKSLKSLPFHH